MTMTMMMNPVVPSVLLLLLIILLVVVVSASSTSSSTTSSFTVVDEVTIVDEPEGEEEDNNNTDRPHVVTSLTAATTPAKEEYKALNNNNDDENGFQDMDRESGTSKSKSEDDEDGNGFTPAQSLDYFKNGMDPTIFEWVNPDEVVAGGTTCGFLYPPLGTDPTKIYPTVQVYICIKFAENQPAPNGNVFVHCGGPGTTSFCLELYSAGFIIGTNNSRNYNIISIDQRGTGRSKPRFNREECKMLERNKNGKVVSDVDPINNLDVSSRESISDYLEQVKRRNRACWTCGKNCGFELSAEQKNGEKEEFHFLEYSGTRLLAADMELFRQAIKAPKLSLYGISYGGMVMSTIATIYPDSVDLLVIDSNGPVDYDLYELAYGRAIQADKRANFVTYSCTYQNIVSPGKCPVDDIHQCLRDLRQIFAEIYPDYQEQQDSFFLYVSAMADDLDYAKEVCDGVAVGDITSIRQGPESEARPRGTADEKWMKTLLANTNQRTPDYRQNARNSRNSQPTFFKDSDVPIDMVFAQDFAGHIYDEELFIDRALAIGAEYDGAGTEYPALNFIANYKIGYYWPRSVPNVPSGDPVVGGIIAGQLYDSVSPYIWTQDTRARFPAGTLLTSQSFSHGLPFAVDEIGFCQDNVKYYFKTRNIRFIDGEVCGSEFPEFLEILENQIY